MFKRTLSVPGSVVAVLALGVPANSFAFAHSRAIPDSVIAVLDAGRPIDGVVFNDADSVIGSNRDRQQEIMEASRAIINRAEGETRDLTAEEQREIEGLTNEFDDIERQITLRERVNAQNALLNAPRGRQTEADQIEGDDAPPAPSNAAARPAAAAPAAPARSERRVPAEPRASARGTFGFRNFGDFAIAARNANPRFGGRTDPRLIENAAASTYASEGVGQDGGFLVPPDFRSEIISRVFGEDSLIERTRRMRSASNTITVPVDTTSPWGGSGVLSYWVGEAQTKTQSKPILENVTVKAHTLATLIPVTEELLEDAPALDGYLRMVAPREMDFKISNAIIRGSGVGQPLGILNSPGLVTVAAESGQSADTLVAQNIFKMFTRAPLASRQNGVWLIHPDAEAQLFGLTIGNQPVYLPAGGMSDAPYGRLMGRPVIPHQVTETVGDLGDLMFVDFDAYMTLTKLGNGRDANGLRTDVSIHLWFDQDLVAYRFTIRIGGQPIWGSSLAQRDGSSVQSPYVVLAAR